MPRFVTLLRFTEQGIKEITQTTQRAAKFEAAAKELGATLVTQYWTMGEWDGFFVVEADDEETVMALMLRLGAQGSVRTSTSRAYAAEEMARVLAKVRPGK